MMDTPVSPSRYAIYRVTSGGSKIRHLLNFRIDSEDHAKRVADEIRQEYPNDEVTVAKNPYIRRRQIR